VFFGGKRLSKKPKTSEFPSPRERLNQPDHLDMNMEDVSAG